MAIIGAGLSGLIAARELASAGHQTVVYEKARGVGGRLATRRVGMARFDHGAQFFTVRGDAFRAVVDEAIEADVVAEWCRGFGEQDGYPRYRGAEGMTSLAKWLADGLDIRLGTRIEDLRSLSADAFVISAPIPQALELLANSAMAVAPALQENLREVRYNRSIAGMFVLDRPSAIELPGGEQHSLPTAYSFVADNYLKGVSKIPAITMHMSNDWSVEHWDTSTAELEQAMRGHVKPLLGEATISEISLHKWRYAGPQNPWPDPCCIVHVDPAVVLCGDAFAGPKVEGAFNSGLAAAKTLKK